MPKKFKNGSKRVKKLFLICTLSAVLLAVSTYAWFVGMRTVNVNPFVVEIAATDGLLLSLDGASWDRTVTIDEDTFSSASYANNTNSWGGSGLVPMSSVGDMDTSSSTMKIYEKASLTPTKGGYRLLASRVNNHTVTLPAVAGAEKDGYVVFDLFVKNISGSQYIPELEPLDEEAIYLTVDSKVEVAEGGESGTGIENSVRVAFAQIGRVVGTTTDPAVITAITCNPDAGGNPQVSNGLTGICRTAQIWEPNDTDHVANAIGWYNTSCKQRKAAGALVTDPNSYEDNTGTCSGVADEVAYPTYAVNAPISSSDNVDVYDGEKYNKYVSTTKLESYPYFTDTHKEMEGTSRPEFMTLAPNSITKVRVYVYIEGQDVDNYDFASIGKRISVQFGFTKERMKGEDYGEPVFVDTTKPVITLIGDAEVTITRGQPYVEQGATANDEGGDGIITRKIKITNPVNVNEIGVYYVAYDVSDWAGNYAARVTRKVTVVAE